MMKKTIRRVNLINTKITTNGVNMRRRRTFKSKRKVFTLKNIISHMKKSINVSMNLYSRYIYIYIYTGKNCYQSITAKIVKHSIYKRIQKIVMYTK